MRLGEDDALNEAQRVGKLSSSVRVTLTATANQVFFSRFEVDDAVERDDNDHDNDA